ncbi:MAG: ATP/cobalamin adenosyltransferase [Bacteroidetes bacterium 38_7]|nr:MAG: ATP/cobalamin adenosyltransferase [Bacteroidetes bacterium 38_7]HAL65675.1 cob(I)yrinic acid a,c-diamide adenosyltransferase [Bacteroidales bacterium]
MGKEGKIYTRTGDEGETSLIGGQRVLKSHERIEAYGTLDELNAFIGLVADLCEDIQAKQLLVLIQGNIFTIESHFAASSPAFQENLPKLAESDIEMLEIEIDRMNKDLPSLDSFILPFGHPSISAAHMARTVCRRAERRIVNVLSGSEQELLGLKFINRLSDFFFVLARRFAFDLKIPEVQWSSKK